MQRGSGTSARDRIRGVGFWRPIAGLLVAAFVVVGLLGGASYWEAYYQHRGFVAPARLHRAGAGRLLSINFYSAALHRSVDYLAYLPAGYDPSHRYPVLYLLHGMPGRPQVYVDIANMDIRLDNRLSLGQVPPMILVFPDGRIGGSTLSDSEWANTPSGQFESYVLEVVRDVDGRFATIPTRQARVIAGFSAGAYGAINIALHHLSVFGNVEAWSGYFRQTRSGVFAHATPAELAYNSPINYVRKMSRQLAAFPFRVFMFVGRGDSASRQIVPMAQALGAAGAHTSYVIYHGGHDWQLWYGHLNQMLILAGQDVLQPLRAAKGVVQRLRAPGRAGRRTRVHVHERRHAPTARARHRRHRRHASSIVPATFLAPPGRRLTVASDRGTTGEATLLAGLLLALGSAAAINLGFLLQHRGLSATRSAGGSSMLLRSTLRNRPWLAGQAIGWIGFGAQIVAVSIAPLALVQSFAAGGLALSVPLAAGVFRQRVSRRQRVAVLLVAAGLGALPIGMSPGAERLQAAPLTGAVALALALGIVVALTRRAPLLAIAAGLFYGVADAAIKAVSVGWGALGAASLLSGWAALAALATFAGFVAFQAALAAGNAISGISLMNCLAALLALGCGVLAFGESLGMSTAASIGHGLAILLVLSCVPVLAAAQAELSEALERVDEEAGAAGRAPWDRAADDEQQRFQPWTQAGVPRPHHIAQP